MKVPKGNVNALISRLVDIQVKTSGDGDWERAHGDADKALLEYIGDDRVRAAHEAVAKWCA